MTDKPTGLDIIDIEIIYTALDLDQKNWLTIGRVAIVEYIIKKLDFETDKITFWKGKFSIGNYADGYHYLPTNDIFKKRGIKIEYLHQLQNLYFALTNQELTIL